ncbi:MAG TPA: response regulator [Verrucomicrobiae bacterium]|nr:response regulator [Verrucomicrobiae bacterium]
MKEHERKLSGNGDAGKVESRQRVTVLHVDDDPNDTALLQAASRKAEVNFELQNVEDGDQAIAYLNGVAPFSDRVRYRIPALVLLDLKMPRATGFEIMRWIRQHPAFAHLPIIVLSGSEMEEDIRNAYAEGANSYLVKPLGFEALVKMIRSINGVWVATSRQIVTASGGRK